MSDDTSAPQPKRKMKIPGLNGEMYIVSLPADENMKTLKSHLVEGTSLAEPAGQQRVEDKTDVSQAWFTSTNDKAAFHEKGHTWKHGQWSNEEIQLLTANIESYCKAHGIRHANEIIFEWSKDERKDFYRTISKGLSRPLFSVYRRVVRMYDKKNHIGKYTPDEVQRLKQLRMKFGNDWAAIGGAIGRSASSVKDRCRLMKDSTNTGKWLAEEEERLAQAVYELARLQPGQNVTGGLCWSLVADRVVTRTEKQCRAKWLNYLNWKMQHGTEWTRDDDSRLIQKLDESSYENENDVDWSALCDSWTSARSPQWLRSKWWSLKRTVPVQEAHSFRGILQLMKSLQQETIRIGHTYPATSQTPASSSSQMQLQIPVFVTEGKENEDDKDENSAIETQNAVIESEQKGNTTDSAVSTTPASSVSNALIVNHSAREPAAMTVNGERVLLQTLPLVTVLDSGVHSFVIAREPTLENPDNRHVLQPNIAATSATPINLNSFVCAQPDGGNSPAYVFAQDDTSILEEVVTTGDPATDSAVSGDPLASEAVVTATDDVGSVTTDQFVVIPSSVTPTPDGAHIHLSTLSDPMLGAHGQSLILMDEIVMEHVTDCDVSSTSQHR